MSSTYEPSLFCSAFQLYDLPIQLHPNVYLLLGRIKVGGFQLNLKYVYVIISRLEMFTDTPSTCICESLHPFNHV